MPGWASTGHFANNSPKFNNENTVTRINVFVFVVDYSILYRQEQWTSTMTVRLFKVDPSPSFKYTVRRRMKPTIGEYSS